MSKQLMTFTEHLEELRTRLKYAIISVLVAMLVAYAFARPLFVILTQPLIKAWHGAGLGPPKLHFANPIEPFFTYLKVALIAGVFAASPVVFYQLWKFVAPGLYKHEKKFVIPFTVASALCFIGGAAFGYFMVFPYGFSFFLGFAQKNMSSVKGLMGGNMELGAAFELTPTLMMGDYFSLVWRMLLGFGLIFELPVVVLFLALIGLVDYKGLWRFNRYFIIIAFFVGAILTPPDVITQILMATPLLVLYNLSILLAYLFGKRKKAQEIPPAKDPPDETA